MLFRRCRWLVLAEMSAPISPHSDITDRLARWHGGDETAFRALLPLIYGSLRDMARRQRARNPPGGLDTTALVHETYLALAQRNPAVFPDRARFYAYVGCTMRSILVDAARREQSLKGGGAYEFVDIAEFFHIPEPERAQEILAVDRALSQLAETDAELLTVVELRFFAGLPVAEVAAAMGISPRTVDRLWQKARLALGVLL